MVIDVKSHENNISNNDINKMIDDCKLHKCHGIMVLSESAYLNSNQESKLKENGVSIIRIKPDENGSYDTRANKKFLNEAINDRFEVKDKPEILFK